MTKINMTTVKKLLSLGFEPIAEYYEKQDTEVVEKLILYQKSNKILLLLPEKGQILYTSPYLSTNEDTHELENLSNVIEYMEAFPKIMKSRPVTTLTILDLPPIGGKEGSKRMQSLNYINSEIADAYQLGKIQENEKGDNKDE